MFDLNPLAQPDAWWQHLVMLGVSALIGYIIGYRTSRGVAANLEEELAGLDAQLEGCRQTLVAVDMPAPTVPAQPFIAPEPLDTVPLPVEVPAVASVVAVPNEAPVHDNLKLVEGIGPKIEGLLNKEGIVSFRQLSEASHERLTDILRAAGKRFQMHDPGSWARQAELAADGKWEELRTWQQELNKGRTT
jgi:predicted flap endonuclease-1-like 5' DNA nuclease